jgi:hypothetical protein
MTLPIHEHVDTNMEPQPFSMEPKVLSMKAYTVNGRPLFYGHEGSSETFCVPEKRWMQSPSYLDYFDQREVAHSDMGDLVLNGLIDDNDFNALNSAGMMDPLLQQLYQKIKELNEKVNQLEGLNKTDDTPIADKPEEVIDESSEDTVEEPSYEIQEGETEEADLDVESASVLQQILDGVSDLDIYEKKILELISQRLSPESSDSVESEPETNEPETDQQNEEN